jgi:hypothetical protein
MPSSTKFSEIFWRFNKLSRRRFERDFVVESTLWSGRQQAKLEQKTYTNVQKDRPALIRALRFAKYIFKYLQGETESKF